MYFLGYDIGSSSVKAAILNAETGKVIAIDHFPKEEAPIKALKPGWAEQNPEDWWAYVKAATKGVLAKADIDKDDIKAIGIAYQMHGLVNVDSDGKPLRDAIIWCDSRAVAYGEKAFEEIGTEKCLNHLLNSPGNFTASKLKWVKENEPETYKHIYKAMLPGDYIAYKLTGKIHTTIEGLSEGTLWDFKENKEANFLLDYYGLEASMRPEIVGTFSNQGNLSAEAAKELGLSESTIVAYRGGDQPNNALSLGVLNPGEIASTAGTSGVVYGIIGAPACDFQSRVNCFAHVNHSKDSARIGALACINGTGILNSWVKRNVAPEGMSYDEMNRAASRVEVGCEGLSILPFGNGAERLLMNKDEGCSIHGLNFNIHRREHVYRAAQEGIAFAMAYGIEIMREMGLEVSTIHAAKANMYLSEIFRETLAAVTGATIKLYETDGAVGAAWGASVGYGLFKSPEDAMTRLQLLTTIDPPKESEPYINAYERWKSILKSSI